MKNTISWEKILGITIIIVGALFGICIGAWLFFIGITQLIEESRAEQMSIFNRNIGIVKILFAPFIGSISAAIIIIPGRALLLMSNKL